MDTKKGTPEGFHTVTASLAVKNCAAAIDYYKKALGAVELYRLAMPDGKIGHCELKIGDSIIFLADECEQGFAKSPESLGGTTAGICLYVEDCDQAYQQAVDHGAKGMMPPQDMFWGDRYGNFCDPFGHYWAVATRKEYLSPKEIEERAQQFFSQMKTSNAA